MYSPAAWIRDAKFLIQQRDSLRPSEKKDYIKAVQCLFDSPSKVDPAIVPGARTRYDDFVAVHINQTLSIHGTVSASSFWYLLFEAALTAPRATF